MQYPALRRRESSNPEAVEKNKRKLNWRASTSENQTSRKQRVRQAIVERAAPQSMWPTTDSRGRFPPFPDLLELRTKYGGISYRLADVEFTPPSSTTVTRRPALITRSKPFSLCIKMTAGSFKKYNDKCLLHAGISDSRGRVYNFDEYGHHIDEDWPESICVPFQHLLPETLTSIKSKDGCLSENLVDVIDTALYQYNLHHLDAGFQYHSCLHNCFHYLVGFLNELKIGGRRHHTLESVETEYLDKPACLSIEFLKVWKQLRREKTTISSALRDAWGNWWNQHYLNPTFSPIKTSQYIEIPDETKGDQYQRNTTKKTISNSSDEIRASSNYKFTVSLYQNGFRINNNSFREAFVPTKGTKIEKKQVSDYVENDDFVYDLLRGEVPSEFIKYTSFKKNGKGIKLDVVLKDERPSEFNNDLMSSSSIDADDECSNITCSSIKSSQVLNIIKKDIASEKHEELQRKRHILREKRKSSLAKVKALGRTLFKWRRRESK